MYSLSSFSSPPPVDDSDDDDDDTTLVTRSENVMKRWTRRLKKLQNREDNGMALTKNNCRACKCTCMYNM